MESRDEEKMSVQANLVIERESKEVVNPPRLLFLTHRFPFPPNRGDRIRSYHQLRTLAQHFDVTLGACNDEITTGDQIEHVQSFCQRVFHCDLKILGRLQETFKAVLSRKSITEGMFRSQSLQGEIVTCQRDAPFDVVLVFCSSMFPYLKHPAFKQTPFVVDLVDVDSEKWKQMSGQSPWWKRLVYRREAIKIRQMEQAIASAAGSVVLVSDDEADLFRSVVKTSTEVRGVSNGVDTDYFTPPDTKPTCVSNVPIGQVDSPPLRLVFTGVLDYAPNVEGLQWFCHHILPDLGRRMNVRFDVVGRRPSAAVESLGDMPNVHVIGEVPDVRSYLHDADVSVSPLKLARGIQNKVLEAMASQLPVVLTPQSADGIAAIDGEEFMIADSDVQWCQSLERLANDAGLRDRMGLAARQRVVNDFSWSARLSPLVETLNRSIASTRAQR